MLNDQDYELLSAYIDGALTPEERTALEARLLAETELREELEALRSTVALVKALPMRQAPRDFRLTRGMVQARRPAARRYVVTSTAISFISAAAAILLIGFSLVLLSGKQANAPQTSSSVALAMTDTTGFAEYNAAQKTASQTAESPLENEASATLLEEAQRQSTEETFGQAAGGADAAAGDQQTQTQPQAPVTAPLNDGLTDIALPTGTITDADAMMFAAPAASDLLEPSASASDFYYDGEAANDAVAQQPMPTAAAVPAQTQAQEVVPPADTASSALAQAASPTAQPTQTPPPTATVTPSSTPSATMTPTVTPTVTATVSATATATLAPTLTMTPVPPASTSAKSIDAPIIMLVAGLLLLAVSGIFYVRSRRQV